MTTATMTFAPNLAELANSIAPKRFIRDPFGLFSGYRAYLVFSHLSAKTDEDLKALGVTRNDLPRIALEAVIG